MSIHVLHRYWRWRPFADQRKPKNAKVIVFDLDLYCTFSSIPAVDSEDVDRREFKNLYTYCTFIMLLYGILLP